VLTTFAQKHLGVKFTFNIFLSISCKALFSLSITPFCYGVLGVEKICVIPKFSKTSQRFSFSEFPTMITFNESMTPHESIEALPRRIMIKPMVL